MLFVSHPVLALSTYESPEPNPIAATGQQPPPKLSRHQKKQNKRIRHSTKLAARLFDQLAAGQSLILSGSKLEARVKVAIDNMIERGLVPEDSQAYYDATLAPRSNRAVHRDISHNPLPEHLVHARHKIEVALGTQGTKAVHVMGADNSPASADSKAYADSGVVVAVPGGIRTAQQMMHYAAQRYRNPDMPPIIIENTAHFWDPLLKVAGVYDDKNRSIVANKDDAQQLGIYVTKSRQETISVARQVMAERAIKPEDYAKTTPLFAPGTVVFLATGTAKKCRQMQAAARAQGYDIQVRPIDQLVDFYTSPDEDKQTYQGNAAVKAQAAMAAWDKMPKTAQDKALANLGLKREQCVIAAEDSGGWFKERNLQKEPEFAAIRHLIPDGANFPGVETGPTIWGGGGVPEFIARARQAILRRAELRGQEPNLGVGNISLLAALPLTADANGQRQMVMTFARRDMFIAAQPEKLPTTGPQNFDLCDFLYPRNSQASERNSPHWEKQSGQRAGALRTLAVFGEANRVDNPPDFQPVADYRAGIFVPGPTRHTPREEFRSDARKLTAHVRSYPAITRLSDVQQKLFAPYDGVALAFDNPKDPGDYASRFITYGYIFFSALVAQQTRDKFMLGKMFAVLDDKRQKSDDKILDRLVAMTYDLHRQGAIPQEPSTLFKRFQSVVDLARAMNGAKKELFRYQPFSYAQGELVLPAGSRNIEKLYGIPVVEAKMPDSNGGGRQLSNPLQTQQGLGFVAPQQQMQQGSPVRRDISDTSRGPVFGQDGVNPLWQAAAKHGAYPEFLYTEANGVLHQSGTPSTKPHHTSILLTASLKGSSVLEHTEAFVEAVAGLNSGIVTGAGLNNGGMGVVTHKMHDLASRGKDVHHTGITTPHIRDFEASGNIEKMVTHFILTRDIYGRIGGLGSADMNTVMDGGAGTLQEKFGILFLKHVARFDPDPALNPYRNNQVMTLNLPVSIDGHKRGFYDVVLQQTPQRVIDDYGIHTPTSVGAAVDIVARQQREMRAAGQKSGFTPIG